MLNAIFVIIGTVIGAGFSSGREIFTFFNVYGIYGLLGLFLSEFLIGLVIYKTFYIIINKRISSYSHFISEVMTKSNFLNNVVCNIMSIFLLISFIVMVAGFSAYFFQEFNISYIFGATLIAVLSFITFLNNVDGIVKINKYFIPLLILIILLLGLKNWDFIITYKYIPKKFNFNWIISSIVYASYNLIVVIPILITLKKYISSNRQAKIVSIVVTLFLLLMSSTIFFLLDYYFNDIKNLELPTVFISSKLGSFYQYSCGLVVLGAIFTTAISSGYGFLSSFNKLSKKQYIILSFLICLSSIAFSNIGFSRLLNLLYPILGILRIYTGYIYMFF